MNKPTSQLFGLKQVKNLAVNLLTLKKSKTPFGEPLWPTGCHAMPLVILFFGVTMLLAGRHAIPVVIWWTTASATDLREVFLLSGVFYLTLLPVVFSGLPWGQQFNLKVSKASCWSSKHSPAQAICLKHHNPQKRYTDRFYLCA